MGGVYLSCFKHTFQVYREATASDDKVQVSLSEEFQETLSIAVRAWARYCPDLREVQFDKNQVWRRAHAKDKWCERLFQWMDGERVMLA